MLQKPKRRRSCSTAVIGRLSFRISVCLSLPFLVCQDPSRGPLERGQFDDSSRGAEPFTARPAASSSCEPRLLVPAPRRRCGRRPALCAPEVYPEGWEAARDHGRALLDFGHDLRFLSPRAQAVGVVCGGEDYGHFDHAHDYTGAADCHDECEPRQLAVL